MIEASGTLNLTGPWAACGLSGDGAAGLLKATPSLQTFRGECCRLRL